MLKRGSKMMQVGCFIYDNFLFTLFQTSESDPKLIQNNIYFRSECAISGSN